MKRHGGPSTVEPGGHVAKLLFMMFAVFYMSAASASDVDALIAQVETKYEGVTVMKANFVQTTKSALYGDQQQKGTLTLKRPSKMRWDFQGDEKTFVTDGTTMWIYTKADNQVIRYNDFASTASTADSLLQSLDQLSRLFAVELVSSGPTVLALTPTDASAASQVKGLQLTLNAELEVSAVSVTDAFDGVTELVFEALELGGEAPDSVFAFTIPEGATVVDAGSTL